MHSHNLMLGTVITLSKNDASLLQNLIGNLPQKA